MTKHSGLMTPSLIGIIKPVFLLSFFAFLIVFSSCDKDDPKPPIELSFGTDTQSTVEGIEINISIPLERPATQSGTIKIALSGNAIYTEDYNTNPSGNDGAFELVINPGETAVSFKVAAVNDEIYQGDKEIIFTLMEPSEGFILGYRKTHTLTINDDESQAVASYEVLAGQVAENYGAGLTMHISLSDPVKGEGTILISLGSINATYGTHYTTLPAPVNGVITLPIENGATGTSITLLPIDDSFFHDNYVVVFEITATTGAVKKGSQIKFVATIAEDESPSFASFTTTDASISEAQTAGIVVPLALSIPASEAGTITVSFTSTDATYGTHFTTSPAASGSNIVLNVSKNDVASQLTIFPIDNNPDNENRVIFFTISSGGGAVRPGGVITYVLTLEDNEPTLRTVLISFGRASAPLVAGPTIWNHLYDDSPSTNDTWSLKRSDGLATGFELIMNSSLTPQPHGSVTGINSGVFPDNAMKEYWYVPGPNQGIMRGFSLRQLDNNVVYTIKIHGGTTQVSLDGRNTMTISVEGDQKSILDVTNNVTQSLLWSNKSPVASILTINLTDTDGGGICMINAMEISWYEN